VVATIMRRRAAPRRSLPGTRGPRTPRARPGADVGGERRDRLARGAAELGVAAHEARRDPLLEAEQVVEDQHLAVAGCTRSDADRRDRQPVADFACQRRGDALEHQRERPRLLAGDGGVEQGGAGLGAAPLHLEATEAVDRLRRQPEMGHHRDLGVDQRADDVDPRPFDLDRRGAALLDEAQGVGDGLVGTEVERAERHVGDQQRAFDAAAHRLHVVEHLVHRHRQRVVVAEHHHRERVADQHQVDAGLVGEKRAGVVVGGDHGEPLAAQRGLAHERHGDLLRVGSHPRRLPVKRWRVEGRVWRRRRAGDLSFGPFSPRVTVGFPIQPRRRPPARRAPLPVSVPHSGGIPAARRV